MGELSFFFGMRHIFKAQTTSITETFTLERNAFMCLIKHYPDQENIIADNALVTYESKTSVTGSKGGLSTASAGTTQTLQSEVMETIIGRGMKHTIHVLKQRRHMAAVEKAVKTAASGDMAGLKRSILGINVNSVNYDGRTCLHLAASNGHYQAVKYLVDVLGADISIIDKHENSALNDAGEIPTFFYPQGLFRFDHSASYPVSNTHDVAMGCICSARLLTCHLSPMLELPQGANLATVLCNPDTTLNDVLPDCAFCNISPARTRRDCCIPARKGS